MLPLIDIGAKILDKVIPDKAEKLNAKARLLEVQQAGELAEIEAAMSVVTAEAKSDSWLTSSWRPITMLSFLMMLMAYWFGFIPDDVYARITPDMYNQFVDLLKIGIGGYIVSRGAEKGIKEWKK